MIIEPSTPFGSTIICDDVRVENNGKKMYIGVYDQMYVHADFPVVLPSLYFVVRYAEGLGESEDAVVIKVFLPGSNVNNPAIEALFWPAGPRSGLGEEKIIQDRPDDEKRDPMRIGTLPLMLSPAVITQEGEIRIRAYRGEDVIKLGAMQVRRASPESDKEQA
jgi:hypothetical protein